MEKAECLQVYLQGDNHGLHPVSKKILTTAAALAQQKKLCAQGILCVEKLTEPLQNDLKSSGLQEITVLESPSFCGFIPEIQTNCLAEIGKNAGIMLFPATPEGRCLSAMTAARLGTGVTADCTELSFTEDGFLLQTRPAFSGSMLASIVTKSTRPQIASLRFGMDAPQNTTETVIHRVPVEADGSAYPVRWLERSQQSREKQKIVLAIGGGLREKADVEIFRRLAEKLGAELCCSRALTDRGWMPKKCQIGLSGRSISAELLITFGVSGSVQFRAGLENIGHLCAVDTDEKTPMMRLADIPVLADLYQMAEKLLKKA